ncbi:MAG: hypothetical protein ACI4SG_08830 [Oligosphaeraceae bacterium]
MRHLLFCLALLALMASSGCSRHPEGTPREAPDTPAVVWCHSSATTPILPLLAAQKTAFPMTLRAWNTTMAFQSLLLAGDGDLWVGHLEGFARAHRRGAPLRLLAVTGWRKWHLLSRRETASFPRDFRGRSVAIAPADGAGRFLLERLLQETGEQEVAVLPLDVKPLLLKALEGKVDDLFLPEPFATVLLEKSPDFHRVDSLEGYYGRVRQCPPEVPWAGIAVNAHWAQQHPQEVDALLAQMVSWSEEGGENAPLLWTEERVAFSGISREELTHSLLLDPVKAVPAWQMSREIEAFLALVAPDVPFSPRMLWEPAR